MSKEFLGYILIVPVFIGLMIYGAVLLSKHENEARDRWQARLSQFMGRSFLLNGHTYTAVSRSDWDGRVRCISATGPEVEIDWLAVETLVTVTVEARP